MGTYLGLFNGTICIPHIDFRRQSSLGSKQGKDGAAQSSCYNLRDTDSTVEKSAAPFWNSISEP